MKTNQKFEKVEPFDFINKAIPQNKDNDVFVVKGFQVSKANKTTQYHG